MTASTMSPRMLYRKILVLTLITEAVHSRPNIYWSKRAGGIMQKQAFSKEIEDEIKPSLHREENKRFNNRKYQLLPFSTIVRSNLFKRNEMTKGKSKSEEKLNLHFLPFSTIVTYGE